MRMRPLANQKHWNISRLQQTNVSIAVWSQWTRCIKEPANKHKTDSNEVVHAHKESYQILNNERERESRRKVLYRKWDKREMTWKQDVRLAKLMQPQIVHIQSDGTVTLLWLDLNALSGPNDGPPAPPVGLLLSRERVAHCNKYQNFNATA